jgi:NAD(P)-dependent dehydrogenase (short-subunit alcohol dehydrogenase family)
LVQVRRAHVGRLDRRVAIVTGAGDGIGRGVARRLAEEGTNVLIADVDEAAAKRVARELRLDLGVDVRALRVDVSSKAENSRWCRRPRIVGALCTSS